MRNKKLSSRKTLNVNEIFLDFTTNYKRNLFLVYEFEFKYV